MGEVRDQADGTSVDGNTTMASDTESERERNPQRHFRYGDSFIIDEEYLDILLEEDVTRRESWLEQGTDSTDETFRQNSIRDLINLDENSPSVVS